VVITPVTGGLSDEQQGNRDFISLNPVFSLKLITDIGSGMKGGFLLKHETIIVLDFGGQYNQLIARRVREANVYCEVLPYHTELKKILDKSPKGIIFTGGPASVLDEDAPKCDPAIFDTGIPVLGICYGMQLMAVTLNGVQTCALPILIRVSLFWEYAMGCS
jgi:carbamoylphosphate synthase small subunit